MSRSSTRKFPSFSGKDSVAERAKQPVREAAEIATERITKEKNWWAWELKAQNETDPAKKELIYREALKDFPDNPGLMAAFAIFLADTGKDYDEAEGLFRRALELEPDANNTGNFALFLTQARKDYDQAERFYRRALELNPNHATNTANFAQFMAEVRNDKDESEKLFRRAIDLDPTDERIRAEYEKLHKKSPYSSDLYQRISSTIPSNVDALTRRD